MKQDEEERARRKQSTWSAFKSSFATVGQSSQSGTLERSANPTASGLVTGGPSHSEGWAASQVVKEVLSLPGSKEYWQPITKLVNDYGVLSRSQTTQRTAMLDQLEAAIDAWRDHQEKTQWKLSNKKKKEALRRLVERIEAERASLVAPEPTAAMSVRPSMPMSIGGRPGAGPSEEEGTESFQQGLASTPDANRLGLIPTVMPNAVRDLPDQRKARVQVQGGVLRTHDGRFDLDSEGSRIRYVLALEGDAPVLYASQDFVGFGRIHDYPTLSSHAQITGNVIGAGDMVVSSGRITEINNQSGTFQPRGAHLAKTLKFLVSLQLLREHEIVDGDVTVAQWISSSDGIDVDQGRLVDLVGSAMAGKLR